MAGRSYYRVIVKNERGKVIIDWTASLFGAITVRIEGGATIIEKKGFLKKRAYVPAINESVEVRNWWERAG